MKEFFFVLISTLMLSSAGWAAKVSTGTLDNGMEIVVLEDHRAPVVVHMVWYRIGAADEPAGKSGIAHFLEHLLFKGTDDLEAGEFSATVTRNGGRDNAFTSWDYTAYFQRIASDRLELMMQMEADRMRDLRMTQEDVATERNVILEERAQRVDSDPSALLREQMRAAQYLNHPYGIPIIGWRQEAENLSRQDAFSFYRRYYAPNNAILIVAGDVEPDEVIELANRHYGPLQPTENLEQRARPQEPPQLAERRLRFSDARIAQPYISRSYLAPERDSGEQEKVAPLKMLASVLGGNGATSVLGRKLQFETRQAVYVNAFYDGVSLDDTTFGLVVVPVEGVSLAQAEQALDDALEQFIQEGIDDDQFARIKMRLRAAQIYSQDNIQSLAQRYGAALTSGLTVEDVQAWPDLLLAVTKEDVMAAAEEIFDRKRAVTSFASPVHSGAEAN